jgi:hypothetical protein
MRMFRAFPQPSPASNLNEIGKFGAASRDFSELKARAAPLEKHFPRAQLGSEGE